MYIFDWYFDLLIHHRIDPTEYMSNIAKTKVVAPAITVSPVPIVPIVPIDQHKSQSVAVNKFVRFNGRNVLVSIKHDLVSLKFFT